MFEVNRSIVTSLAQPIAVLVRPKPAYKKTRLCHYIIRTERRAADHKTMSFANNTQPTSIDSNSDDSFDDDMMICQICYHRIESHGLCPCLGHNAVEWVRFGESGSFGRRIRRWFSGKRKSGYQWEGDGRAVAPCLCRGSLGYAHQRCVFRAIRGWHRDRCETCGFKYEDRIAKLPFRSVSPGF